MIPSEKCNENTLGNVTKIYSSIRNGIENIRNYKDTCLANNVKSKETYSSLFTKYISIYGISIHTQDPENLKRMLQQKIFLSYVQVIITSSHIATFLTYKYFISSLRWFRDTTFTDATDTETIVRSGEKIVQRTMALWSDTTLRKEEAHLRR